MKEKGSLSRREFLRGLAVVSAAAFVACTPENDPEKNVQEGSGFGDRFGRMEEKDGKWGAFQVGEANVGTIQRLSSIETQEVGEKILSSIEETAKKMRIEDLETGFVEVEGDKSKALIPLMWTLKDKRVDQRWSAWSMNEGVVTPPNDENSDNMVFIELSKLRVQEGVDVIGPVKGYSVEPFIAVVKDSYVTANLPFKDVVEKDVPMHNILKDPKMNEFLTK